MSEAPDSNLFDTPPTEAGEVHLKPDIERAYEQGEINMAQARQLSGHVASEHKVEVVAEASAPASEAPKRPLELVTDEHVPRPDARREAKLKPAPKPRNWRERMAADQAPPHQRVTPLGHDPHVVSRDGDHTKRN